MLPSLELLLRGTVIPAMPLALNSQRKPDEKRQRALVRYYAHAGVGGLAVGVHTTQFAIRNPEIALFKPTLTLAADELKACEKTLSRPLVKVAGVCGPVEQAVAEARLAAGLGYDAALLSPGGLAALSEDEMIYRTKAVAEIIPVVGFYLQPAVGGRVFSENYWSRLAETPNVVGIKAAPFNRYQTLELVRAVALSSRRDEIALYTGNDDNIVIDLLTNYEFNVDGQTITKGFIGGLLGHWAVWTHSAVKMFDELTKARIAGKITPEHLVLAAQVTDCNSAFFDSANGFAGCIAGLHEVLRRQGLLEGTWCLDPSEAMSPGQSEEIDRVYRAYPQLCDDEFIKQNLSTFMGE